jgi:hypothetical protein
MANYQRGGLRWVRSRTNPDQHSPPIEFKTVATSYATALYTGDIVKIVSDGTIAAAAAGDTAYGVFDGAEQYYDVANGVMKKGGSLPSTVAWGTVWERRSVARVIPFRGQVFRMCCDDATTFTTPATYDDSVGENCEWIAGTAVGDQSGTLLDISTNNTTNTLSLRILSYPNQNLTDFASAYVPVDVVANLIQDEASGSTTGT